MGANKFLDSGTYSNVDLKIIEHKISFVCNEIV